MFRNKYKYSKNHGLLPSVSCKPYRSPLTSLAILGKNDQKEYSLHINPNNPNLFMVFNDREYIHRECSMIADSDSPQLMSQMLKKAPLKDKSLTVYVANDYKACENNLIGQKDWQDSLLWLIYRDMVCKKRQRSKIVMSVLGVQSQNEMTDLLVIEQASEFNDFLPEYLKDEMFRKRRIRVSKNYVTGRSQPQNSYLQQLHSQDDLRETILRYQTIKTEMQTMKFSNSNWNWFEGELFLFSQIQQDEQQPSLLRRLKTHFVLRVNQYLRSTSSLMLKLGMNLRKMQERYSNIVCDNNESKLFRVLKECFQKKRESENYHIYLILQIGHYQTLKDQYQNLVPTSELLSTKYDSKAASIKNASFLYIRHYHDHPNLVTLLTQITQNNKQSKNIQEYLQEGSNRKNKSTTKIKSYIYDTISSIQKKNIRNVLMREEEGEEEIDLEGVIKNNAKLYKQEGTPKNRESLSGGNKTGFKKSQNKTQHRMSLFQWGNNRQRSNRVPKVYASRREKGSLSEIERRSAECCRVGSDSHKWKKYGNLNTVYGVLPRKGGEVDIRTYASSKQEKPTKQIIDDLVQKEILSMGKDDDFYHEEASELETPNMT